MFLLVLPMNSLHVCANFNICYILKIILCIVIPISCSSLLSGLKKKKTQYIKFSLFSLAIIRHFVALPFKFTVKL